MRRIIFLLTVYVSIGFTSLAQDYSRRGLMEIKEQSEAARLDWNKAFDQAAETNKDFKALAGQRQALQQYIDLHLNNIRKLTAQGDERALLTAVDNYLQIQKQYVKTVMATAENLDGSDPEAINKVTSQTAEFMQKERIFLMEINNALATSTEQEAPVQATLEVEEEEEMEEDAVTQESPEMEERTKAKKKAKLPHEVYDQEGKEGEELRNKNKKIKERKRSNEDEGEEEEEE